MNIWNSLQNEVISIIREKNSERRIIVTYTGAVNNIYNLQLPNDSNLILTVHHYAPFQFTHQGADWLGDKSQTWLGTIWDASYYEKKPIENAMKYLRDFSISRKIPVYIGEFGALDRADLQSRAKWTAYCARLFESYGFSWA